MGSGPCRDSAIFCTETDFSQDIIPYWQRHVNMILISLYLSTERYIRIGRKGLFFSSMPPISVSFGSHFRTLCSRKSIFKDDKKGTAK